MVESMIRLFPTSATTFTTNGIGTLPDATVCTVTEERNGEFELEMEYPITGRRYNELENHRIIVVKSNPFSNPQPFRIYNISKPIDGIVTISAEHISYDLIGYISAPIVANLAKTVFEQLKSSSVPSCPFTFLTDIDTEGLFSSMKPASIRSLLLGSDASAIRAFGGELEFDNFTVKLLKNRGSNRGASIRYGKNMTDFQQEENCSEVYTGVYPFWYSEQDGLMDLTGNKTIAGKGTYDFVRIYLLDLSEEFSEKPSEESLREAAEKWVEENDIGVPKVSFTVSFVQLADFEEYRDIALLEDIRLCDTVRVEFPDYNVSTTSKCIKTVYNVLTNKYDSIELGDVKTDIATTIAVQNQTLDAQQKTLATDTPSKSFMQEAIDHATQMITGGLGGYVILNDSNGDGYPDEILIMDTDNINTAQNIWRWNKGGLGHSSNGYNGPYETAITMDGWIVGKYIAANSVSAEQLTVEYKESVSNEISGAVSDLQKEMNKEFDDVDTALEDLNTTLETTVADGIITESEKAAINKMLQVLEKEKKEADDKYNEIIQDTGIPQEDRNNLTTLYTALYGSSANSIYVLLVSSIQTVLNSDREHLDANMATYRTNYSNYSTKSSEFHLALDALAEKMANKYAKDYADGIKAAVDKEFDDVEKNLGSLNESLEEVASDGVITESEKAAISKMLQIVEKEKKEADEQYEKLYSNSYLNSKTELSNAYTAVYGSSTTSAYNKLVASINKVLNSVNKEQVDANMATYRTDYTNYSTKLAALKLAIANATEQIANAYAKSTSETTLETAIKSEKGSINMYVKETVTAATTYEDGTTVKSVVKEQGSQIEINKQNIELKVEKKDWDANFKSSIDIWWDGIEIASSKIDLTAVNDAIDGKLDSNSFNSTAEEWAKSSKELQSLISMEVGKIEIQASQIKLEGYITANQTFSIDTEGSIKATGGTIGGFTITGGSIYRGDGRLETAGQGNIYIGVDGIGIAGKFKVTNAGILTCSGATISGNITANSGKIGGFTITDNSIYRGGGTLQSGNNGDIYIGSDGIGIAGKFKVTNAGALTSTSGSIAGWNITSYCLYKNSSEFGKTGGLYFGTSGLSISSTFKVGINGGLTCTSGKIAGWSIETTKLTSADSTIEIYTGSSSNSSYIKIGESQLVSNGHGIKITNGLELHVASSGSGFSDGTNTFMIYGLKGTTGGSPLKINTGTGSPVVFYEASSSKRYKNHVSSMTIEEAKALLKIPVIWFQYKDGYLTKGDRFEGKSMPGIYAEDVYDSFPWAASLDPQNNLPEDWNYRILIPVMLKLIQHLYEKEEIKS